MNYKEKLLEGLKKHISFIQEKIILKKKEVILLNDKNLGAMKGMKPEDRVVFMQVHAQLVNRALELEHLYKTPYFAKCVVTLEKTGEQKEYFFAKHQLTEEGVYSWVAPVAAIRFENPGPASYKLPNGKVRNLDILNKEQYMIVDGKVMFFAREELGKARDLIYQEHFTTKVHGFVLPEIVAQMEKAQDQVIRASHKGPLVISGPAGSGKTTLALHRVAYLTQAPETLALYPASSIIVFVQDQGTKEYFSHLLPELGINNVEITTFWQWAFKVLGLEGYSYISRYGEAEEEKDTYEYQKIKALRTEIISNYSVDCFRILSAKYKKHLSLKNLKLFIKQREEMKLDRFDIVVLLQAYLKKNKKFEIKRSYLTPVNGELKKKVEKTPVSYSLIILDEFQNYLPEQIAILKSCLQEETESIVYVGDVSQQVYLGTIRNWVDAGENIVPERNIKMDKVYRNTKNILSYIQSLGYETVIPKGINEGPEVLEKVFDSTVEEIKYIKEVSAKYKDGTVGVLAKGASYLEEFKKEFIDEKNIHVLTMNEAQGVEFDLVCIVGIDQGTFNVASHIDALPEHIEERKKMQKDLLYVALTRAINELHILGKTKLSEIQKFEVN